MCRLRVGLHGKQKKKKETVTEVLKMLREAAGRRQHFQDRFSIPRKVTCHQSLCIARHITRHKASQITRQRTLQKTLQIICQLIHSITPQIPRHKTRQIIVIIISAGFVGTVAISYQVAITISQKANLRLSFFTTLLFIF